MKIFGENVKRIEEHNSRSETYKLGINEMSDLSAEEKREKYLLPMRRVVQEKKTHLKSTVPDSWDWRKNNSVTPVKDEGDCGSCWAFGTTGCVEGCVAKASGKLVSLSEQQLVDCDHTCFGCSGGLASKAFQWIIQNKGICSEAAYPYVAVQQTCKPCTVSASITSATQSAVQNEEALKENCYNFGPISVSFYVMDDFFNYKSGVYYNSKCPSDSTNYAALIVGYGYDSSSSLDYWILKNSWGTSWGISGYAWIARNKGGMCGIATDAWYLEGCQSL
eukprot:Anaeramoba_ignava/c18192_g1_i1.p1 GENE.c18192_g1_i1~~c18192_g1_i1.p1  ORF type:complete len:277 (-),score=45.51 c18192_g1_i1:71-901(-)